MFKDKMIIAQIRADCKRRGTKTGGDLKGEAFENGCPARTADFSKGEAFQTFALRGRRAKGASSLCQFPLPIPRDPLTHPVRLRLTFPGPRETSLAEQSNSTERTSCGLCHCGQRSCEATPGECSAFSVGHLRGGLGLRSKPVGHELVLPGAARIGHITDYKGAAFVSF